MKVPKIYDISNTRKTQITKTILHLEVRDQWSEQHCTTVWQFFCIVQSEQGNRLNHTHQIRWVVDRVKVWYFLSNADDRLTIDGECTAWNKRERRCIWSEKKRNSTLFSISKFLDVWILQEVWHLLQLVMKNHIVKLRGACLRDIQGVFFTSHVQLTPSTVHSVGGGKAVNSLKKWPFHYRDSRGEFQPFCLQELAY